jgi:CubicO group peptidase (beta-lactamase class C family)
VALDDWIARLAALPLIDQPGAAFHYGSNDLLGRLIARMEDVSHGDLLPHRIFDPLGMHATGFTVPRERLDRAGPGYTASTSAGHLAARLSAKGG